MPRMNKKTTSEKANSGSNTVISLYFKIREEITPQNHSLLRRYLNHYFNLRSNIMNIAGRLPENSRNRFVDRQSKKNSKKDRSKKFVFSLKADLLYFD